MNKDNKKIATMGERIREQRLRLHMTQEKLAEVMYVSKMAISQYENDQVDIKGSVLIELAGRLKTTPNYLLLGAVNTPVDALEPDTARLVSAFEQISDERIRQLLVAQVEAALALEVK